MAALASTSLAVKSLGSASSAFSGAAVSAPQNTSVVKVGTFQCRASAEEQEAVSRRSALALVAGAAALSLKTSPALAAYGEAANVFGKAPGSTDFIPFTGEGFKIDIPSKWNPSKERGEFPGILLRYEDNFDAVCNLTVMAVPTSLSSAKDLPAEEFLSKFNYLLGTQAFDKETASEGGFAKNATITAALLDTPELKTVDGTAYLNLNVLVRAADGNEGGRHQLYSVFVSKGKLYVARVQAGDKRWFKGLKKFVEGAANSFAVA